MKKHETSDIHPQEFDATNEHQMRLAKVAQLRAQGVEAWPQSKKVNATAVRIKQEFVGDQEMGDYQIAGRVMSIRHHGKASFVVIQDNTGTIQLYIRQDQIGEKLYDLFKHMIDMGDIIWCQGPAFKTKTGEVTIKAKSLEILSKSLHPLPEKFHGLTDIEKIYRQRYLDLIANPESRERFLKRCEIIRQLRRYLDEHGYIEVETPMLHPIPGGAVARPFITHHNALDSDFYLRIAPELYLKRLVVGGFERVYEINRSFRNEGISTRHNPEFTMLEFYTAYQDYEYAMNFVQELLQSLVQKVCGNELIRYGDIHLDFGKPFARMRLYDAVKKYTQATDQELSQTSIDATLQKFNVPQAPKSNSWAQKLYALFEQVVEKKLQQPTYITHFPIEVSPLAKRDPEDPQFAARFELFIAGMEFCNAFNELNDPMDQAARFHEQAHARAHGDDEAHYYDADYITALEHGLPPTVGVGIGIDRLTMLLTNTTSIKDVILFPTLKKVTHV